MKQILYLFLFICSIAKSQDTIYKRNGESLAAKIIEINYLEIKYKKHNFQDGPLFVSDKNEIQKIKFSNGVVDSFTVSQPITSPQLTNPVVIIQRPAVVSNPNIIRNPRGSLFYYNESRLSEKRMLFLAIDKNRKWKNKELDKAIIATRDYKSNQYIAGFGGAALAIACVFAAGQSSTSNNSSGVVPLGLAFNAIGIFVASQIVSPIFKIRRTQNARKVVQLFNEEAIK